MYHAKLFCPVICPSCKLAMKTNEDGSQRCVTSQCREYGRDYVPIMPSIPMMPYEKWRGAAAGEGGR